MQPGYSLMKLNVSNVPTDSTPLKQTAGRDQPPQQAHTCGQQSASGLPWLRTCRSRARSTPPDPKGS